MFLVPIYTQKISEMELFTIYQCWLLLERNGTHCISVNSEADAEGFIKENGIALQTPPKREGNLIFLDVDKDNTALEEFYSWAEVHPNDQPPKEVWRPFLWQVSKKEAGKDVWGTNNYLKLLECAPPNDTIRTILEAYFSKVYRL